MGLFLGQHLWSHVQFQVPRPWALPSWKTDKFELGISQMTTKPETDLDIKAQLKELNITAVKDIAAGRGQKATIILATVPQQKSSQKTHVKLVHEWKGISSGKHVVFLFGEFSLSQLEKLHEK